MSISEFIQMATLLRLMYGKWPGTQINLMDFNTPLLILEKAKGLLAMITLRGKVTTDITRTKSTHIHLKM